MLLVFLIDIDGATALFFVCQTCLINHLHIDAGRVAPTSLKSSLS